MISNKTYIIIIIRTILIVATCVLIAYTLPSGKPFVIFNHSALLIIQVVLLIRFLNRTNYEIARIFDSIRDRDFSITVKNAGGSRSQKKLYKSLDNLINILKESQIESITKNQELYAAIENINTGLLWFTEGGSIRLINKATKDLLGIQSLHNIRELDLINKEFTTCLRDIKPSEKRVFKLFIRNEPLQLAIKASIMIQREKRIKLISLQNIKSELDEAEMDSWQKLIRVLAHEIMNSIGPITTSTSAISKYFKQDEQAVNQESIDEGIIENTIQGLQIIEERSIGLKAFVNNYRQLTNLPDPNFEDINLDEFISKILHLLKEDLKDIEINKEVSPDHLKVRIDPKLMSQVIINLLINAKHTLVDIEKPQIKISTNVIDNRVHLNISDNGKGIPSDILDKIFIPFFTTKEDGSGIGLSLSRQIVRLHGGNISVKTEPESGTTFTIRF